MVSAPGFAPSRVRSPLPDVFPTRRHRIPLASSDLRRGSTPIFGKKFEESSFWGTFPAGFQNADPQVSGGESFTTRSGEKIVRVPYPRNWQDLRTRVRNRRLSVLKCVRKKHRNELWQLSLDPKKETKFWAFARARRKWLTTPSLPRARERGGGRGSGVGCVAGRRFSRGR